MDCEMFRKSINQFRHHPILYQRLIRNHLVENPNCNCDIREEIK